MRTHFLATGTLFSVVLLAGAAQAVSQPVIVNIAFDTPLAMTKNNDINFGVVAAAQPATYVISPAGVITAAGGGRILGGLQERGAFTIMGSETQAVDISVANYVASAGVTPSAATCLYNDRGPAAPCALVSQAAPGKGKPLLIGATVKVDGSQKIGTAAAPAFDVVVNYH